MLGLDMVGIFFKKCFLAILVVSSFLHISNSFASAVFEQGSFFLGSIESGLVRESTEKINAKLSIFVTGLIADSSFDQKGDVVPLFGRFGSINFDSFAKSKIGTSDLLSSNLFAAEICPKTAAFKNNLQSFPSLSKEVFCGGKLRMAEVNFRLGAVFPESSFYFEAHLPLRFLTLRELKFQSANFKENDFTDFLNLNFDGVLEEHKFVSMKKEYDLRGLSDSSFYFGWQGREEFDNAKIQASWINVSAGVMLPFSTIVDKNKSFFLNLPLSFGGSFATIFKYSAGILFDKKFELVGFGENYAFFKKVDCFKPNISEKTLFFNFFDPVELELRRGSFWKAGFFLNSNLLADDLFVKIGYSYQSQEQSRFRYSDKLPRYPVRLYDLNLVESSVLSTPPTAEEVDRKARSQYQLDEYYLNLDPRLKRAYCHVLHLGLCGKPGNICKKCELASVSFVFSKPILGKGIFNSFECSSLMELSLSFSF